MSITLDIGEITPDALGAGLAFDIPREVRVGDDTPLCGLTWLPGDSEDLLEYSSTDARIQRVYIGGAGLEFDIGDIVGGFSFDVSSEAVGSVEMLSTDGADMELDVLPQLRSTVFDDGEDIGHSVAPYDALPAEMGVPGHLLLHVLPMEPNQAGFEVTIDQHLDLYRTPEDRESMTGRVLHAVRLQSQELPATVTVEGDEPAGTVVVLSGDPAGFDFVAKANGTDEGEQGGEHIVLCSFQPITPKDRDTVAEITGGSTAYWLIADIDADIRDAQSGTADRVVYFGEEYEVKLIERSDNGILPHIKALCVSLKRFA